MSNLNVVVASPKDSEPESYFSWSECEHCDGIAGNRYDIIYREELAGDIYEASVCPDCFATLVG